MMCEPVIVLNCPLCENRDCELNVESRCHDIQTMLCEAPDGMYGCSGAVVDSDQIISFSFLDHG